MFAIQNFSKCCKCTPQIKALKFLTNISIYALVHYTTHSKNKLDCYIIVYMVRTYSKGIWTVSAFSTRTLRIGIAVNWKSRRETGWKRPLKRCASEFIYNWYIIQWLLILSHQRIDNSHGQCGQFIDVILLIVVTLQACKQWGTLLQHVQSIQFTFCCWSLTAHLLTPDTTSSLTVSDN